MQEDNPRKILGKSERDSETDGDRRLRKWKNESWWARDKRRLQKMSDSDLKIFKRILRRFFSICFLWKTYQRKMLVECKYTHMCFKFKFLLKRLPNRYGYKTSPYSLMLSNLLIDEHEHFKKDMKSLILEGVLFYVVIQKRFLWKLGKDNGARRAGFKI